MKFTPQPVVYRGTASGLRVSAIDGTAFIDNLPSAVTDLVTAAPGVYLAEIYDNAGRALKGVLGSVGTGETLGADLLAGWDFTSGWTAGTSCVINDSNTFTTTHTTTSGRGVYKNGIIDDGKLYSRFFNRTTTANSCALHFGLAAAIGSDTSGISGVSPAYYVANGTSISVFLRNIYAGGDAATDVTEMYIKQVLTPSAQGATIVSAKGGATQNFSYKNASFAYNAASYQVVVKKIRGRALNLSGTATGIRFSAIDDTAFLDNLPAGVLPYADGKHYIKIFDSAGKYVEGVLKAVGSGETLGSEKITTWENIGYETLTLSGKDITQAVNSDSSSARTYFQLNLPAGVLTYFVIGTFTLNSGAAPFFALSSSSSGLGQVVPYIPVGSMASGVSIYSVNLAVNYYYGFRNNTTNGDWAASGISCKQVLTPSASGATIVNAISGTTYRFITKETGFNFNDTGTFSYQIWSS